MKLKRFSHALLIQIVFIGACWAPETSQTSTDLTCSQQVSGNLTVKSENIFETLEKYRRPVTMPQFPSPGKSNPLIEEARKLHAYEDFKILSDLEPKILTNERQEEIKTEALGIQGSDATETRRLQVKFLIENLFQTEESLQNAPSEITQPLWKLPDSDDHNGPFAYTERAYQTLVKRTTATSRSSLIPVPFPILIPGSRFRESYYWDNFFGLQGLIATNRILLALMQVENFLFMIENYGLIPNGLRDYYLTRSQPPVISSMIVELYPYVQNLPRGKEWIRRAFFLLKKDYHGFWMSKSRFHAKTRLNHHWDAENRPREERFGADKEEELAETYRDVRAEAESGKDFTEAFEGRCTQFAPTLLNALMYKYESDLAHIARWIESRDEEKRYATAAKSRAHAIDKYLWDPTRNSYFDYNFVTKKHSGVMTADIFALVWADAIPNLKKFLVLKAS